MSDESGTATWVVHRVIDEVATLTITSGPDAGTSLVLDRPVVRIGSGEASDVRLSDRAVSRVHCELTLHEGRVRLRDLGSKNGTWIAGCRVFDAELGPSAELCVGESRVLVSFEPREVQRASWPSDRYGPLVGRSRAMQQLFALIERVAPSRETVLVRGDSGTGKELVARVLHERGPRPDGPFVILDGAALSSTLVESELFGHARGAFTGAVAARAGALERAHGGTLFIDEIGELALDVQPKLLRFLEEGTVARLGETERRRVDARVVAATHRPLERMMNEGAFREDLFHRLAVIELRVPPLAERPDDVSLIAHALLAELAPADPALTRALDAALAERARYAWPGNVRELRNLVRRIAAFGEAIGGGPGETAGEPSDLLESPRVDLPMREAKQRWIEIFERRYLERLMSEAGGNVSEAARRAEVDRGHLGKLAARYGLKRR